MKFGDYLLPEHFTATFKIYDNDSKRVTKENASSFEFWTVELLIRISKAETVEIVQSNVLGANPKREHSISFPTRPIHPQNYSSLQSRHFTQLAKHRPLFLSHAVTNALQLLTYVETKGGGHSWNMGGQPKSFSEDELKKLGNLVENQSYVKKDQHHYEQVATRYLSLIRSGDTTPVLTLTNTYYPGKSVKTVGEWVTECRKRKLIPKAKPGKNSPLPRTTTKKAQTTTKKGKS